MAENWVPLVTALNVGADPVFRAAVRTLRDRSDRGDSVALDGICETILHGGTLRALNVMFEILRDNQWAAGLAGPINLALVASRHAEPAIREAAGSFLGYAPRTRAVEEALQSLLADEQSNVQTAALTSYYSEASIAPSGDGSDIQPASVRLLSEGDEAEAESLLDEVERALDFLQDLGLPDSQSRVIDDLIRPRLEVLRRLIGAQFSDPDALVQAQHRFITNWDGVGALTKSVAWTVPVIGATDDAAANLAAVAGRVAAFAAHLLNAM